MPLPKKVDLLPAKIRKWLEIELKKRGFGDYVALADDLNIKLANEGVEMRISKSALNVYGRYVKSHDEIGKWAQDWLSDQGLEEEAKRHSVLFNMLTSLAFNFMKTQMSDGAVVKASELQAIGRMMRDVMNSTGLREQIQNAQTKAQSARLDDAVKAGDIYKAAADRARKIMGFM